MVKAPKGLLSAAKPAAQWPPYPPVDESDDARAARIAEEEEAKRISDSIDRSLSAEKEHRKSGTHAKILLLGQAESGKSTILKNIQLHFSPKAFESEAEVWRPVIHLNLVRSINFILSFLSSKQRDAPSSHQRTSDAFSNDLRRLCISLVPLREVEASLTKGLTGIGMASSPTSSVGSSTAYNPAKASEVAVRSSSGWKAFLMGKRTTNDSIRSTEKSEVVADRRILSTCADEMIKLWMNPDVQQWLRDREISLQEQPGFFLTDIERVTRLDYVPTSADILRARVTTIGPEEHHIQLESPGVHKAAKEWIVYDVGGSRSQRAAWAQYFDDVNVIIFLAPLSAFNQALAEDKTVNRLTDSLKLWKMICSNKLLSNVELILFLNKLDVLDVKLRAGIQFSRYVKTYKGTNETKPVSKYIFIALHAQNTPKKRKIHPHLTCAIDTKATASVIDRIHELVIVKVLSESSIL